MAGSSCVDPSRVYDFRRGTTTDADDDTVDDTDDDATLLLEPPPALLESDTPVFLAAFFCAGSGEARVGNGRAKGRRKRRKRQP